jgi:hypothetical protein
MKHRATIVFLLCATAAAFAQPPQPQGRGQQQEPRGEQHGEQRRGPPQEAFDACKGKKDGDSTELKTPNGEKRKGSCRLVFIPSDSGPGR